MQEYGTKQSEINMSKTLTLYLLSFQLFQQYFQSENNLSQINLYTRLSDPKKSQLIINYDTDITTLK